MPCIKSRQYGEITIHINPCPWETWWAFHIHLNLSQVVSVLYPYTTPPGPTYITNINVLFVLILHISSIHPINMDMDKLVSPTPSCRTPRSPTSLEFMSKLSRTSLQRTASAIAKQPRLGMRFLGSKAGSDDLEWTWMRRARWLRDLEVLGSHYI